MSGDDRIRDERDKGAWRALKKVHDFMAGEIASGDSDLWTSEYAELFDLVENTMSFCPEDIGATS